MVDLSGPGGGFCYRSSLGDWSLPCSAGARTQTAGCPLCRRQSEVEVCHDADKEAQVARSHRFAGGPCLCRQLGRQPGPQHAG